MPFLDRRSFLTGTAGAAAAVGLGAAVPGVVGAQNAVGASGSTGLQPLGGPGFLGVTAPEGVGQALGRIRFQLPGGMGEWIPFPHADGGREASGAAASGVVATPAGATGYEVEAPGGSTPVFAGTGYAAPAAPEGTEVQGMRQVPGIAQYAALPTVDVYGIPVVPRPAWGADESIMSWGPSFRQAQVITVHHSVTPAGWDPAATMRGFQRYHSLTNGWGDIGYNLVIDPSGQVYEGRFTGGWPVFAGATPAGVAPAVVTGAHVAGNNSGNVGVCLMGNFEDGLPMPGAYAALVNVIAKLSNALNIDPMQGVRYYNADGDFFRDMQAVNGHRDWMGTACPGGMLWNTLPQVRQAAQFARNSGTWFPTSAGAPAIGLPGSVG